MAGAWTRPNNHSYAENHIYCKHETYYLTTNDLGIKIGAENGFKGSLVRIL